MKSFWTLRIVKPPKLSTTQRVVLLKKYNMKYLTEYRDPELAQRYLTEIHKAVTRPWTIMEVCGGQTHSLVKNGILAMLPKEINMVHGPGCPVCVLPIGRVECCVV